MRSPDRPQPFCAVLHRPDETKGHPAPEQILLSAAEGAIAPLQHQTTWRKQVARFSNPNVVYVKSCLLLHNPYVSSTLSQKIARVDVVVEIPITHPLKISVARIKPLQIRRSHSTKISDC